MNLSQRYQEVLEMEKIEWEKKCKELMQERQDYKAWYFIPADTGPIEKANALGWTSFARRVWDPEVLEADSPTISRQGKKAFGLRMEKEQTAIVCCVMLQ